MRTPLATLSLALALLTATTACELADEHYLGPGDDPGIAGGSVTEPHSGTRLKVRSIVYAGGVHDPRWIYDAQLGVECSRMSWSDGTDYCTPRGLSIVYSDPTCSTAVAMAETAPCSTPDTFPSYVTDIAFSPPMPLPKAEVHHLYRRGNPLLLSGYFSKNGDACGMAAVGPDMTFYELGEEIAPSSLAPVAIESARDGAFSQRVVRSPDGLVFPMTATLHDNAHDFDCFLNDSHGAIGSSLCRPYDSVAAGSFGDAQCTTPVAGTTAAQPPGHIVYQLEGACDASYTTAGPAVPSSPLYERAQPSNTCTATPATPGMTYYSLGDPIELARLTRIPDNVAGRRIQYLNMTAGPQQFHDYSLYDAELKTECRSVTLSDGTARCLPIGPFVQTLYVDPSCQQTIQVISAPRSVGACPAPSTQPYAMSYTGTCGVPDIREIREVYEGPVYTNFGGCTEAPPSAAMAYYRVGPLVGTLSFARATVELDP